MKKFLVIIIYLFVSMSNTSAMGNKAPDFDFPEDVITKANADLDLAIKDYDGPAAIDAVLRIKEAQCRISDKNRKQAINTIDSVAAIFADDAATHALLKLEAILTLNSGYRYSDTSKEELRSRISELIEAAGITKTFKLETFRKVIDFKPDEPRFYHTVYDFVIHSLLNASKRHFPEMQSDLYGKWIEAAGKNAGKKIYILSRQYANASREDALSMYETYKNYPESALLLGIADYCATLEEYDLLTDYLSKFGDSKFADIVRNIVNQLETKSVMVEVPSLVNSRDKIKVELSRCDNVKKIQLMVYRLPEKEDGNKYGDVLLNRCTLVDKIIVEFDAALPFTNEQRTITLNPLPYGKYAIVPEIISDKGRVLNRTNRIHKGYETFTVSDINLFAVKTLGNEEVHAIDAQTGAPRKDVNITISKYDLEARGTAGDDRYANPLDIANYIKADKPSYSAKIFTDLAVYRPGETVQFAAICYETTINERKFLKGKRVSIELADANRQKVDSLALVTDEFGKVSGMLTIPADRLTGTYTLRLRVFLDKETIHQSEHFEVSEYVAPKFQITLDPTKRTIATGENATISGKVMSYSGAPLANQKVTVTLRRNEWDWLFWWYRNCNRVGNLLHTLTVNTDGEGNFSATFDASLMARPEYATIYDHYQFSITAQCTNGAGESHEVTAPAFAVGHVNTIEFNDYNFAAWASKEVALPLKVESTDTDRGNTRCTFTISKNGEEVHKGEFEAKNPVADLSSLPSGQYTIKVTMAADSTATAEASLILARPTDKRAPIDDCPMWICPLDQKVDSDGNAVVLIGTSTAKSHIYYVASSRSQIIEKGWIEYTPGIHKFSIKAPTGIDETLSVQFITGYQQKITTETVNWQLPNQDKVKIIASSFRDKITPNSHEKWTFKVVDADGHPVKASMILDMYDSALNQISDNRWWFQSPSYNHTALYSTEIPYFHHTSTSGSWAKPQKEVPEINCPQFVYDALTHSFVLFHRKGLYAAANDMMPMASALHVEAREDGFDEMEASLEKERKQKQETLNEDVTLREADVKTALWMPHLVTDSEGNIMVEFDVPNYNTTWQLQAIALNSRLTAEQFNATVLSSKPVMVESALPRFVRTGDKVTFTSPVINREDSAAIVMCDVKFFDPATRKVLHHEERTIVISAHSQAVMSSEFTVPDGYAELGYRITATSGDYSDGEQRLLPVLPASSAVIETIPFYLKPGEKSFTHDLVPAPGAHVTLEVCNNPMWFCAMALPSIFNDWGNTSTAMAHKIYALQTARRIFTEAPAVAAAISKWATEHSELLKSPLEQKEDLKISTLIATPWIDEAQAETARMQHLAQWSDSLYTSAATKALIHKLLTLQQEDGGFAWMKANWCKSSLYCTQSVLELIPDLGNSEAIQRAVAYIDKENVKRLNEMKKHGNVANYSVFSDYVYVRSLYSHIPFTPEAKDLFTKALKAMRTAWSGKSLSDKAFYATTLEVNGYHEEASRIMESISQHDYMHCDTRTTAHLLEAFSLIGSHPQETENLQNILIQQKRSCNWGNTSLSAQAVKVLMRTGYQYLTDGDSLVVEKKDVSGESRIEINRENATSPAWGAIYQQYTAVASEIKAVACSELAVTKEVLRYGADGKLRPVNGEDLRTGDKVQIRFTLTNDKELQYVTVRDERAACIEPVSQLAEYRGASDVWFYLEPRDAVSNLFIERLLPGKHHVSYDAYITKSGVYSTGIATAQSQYAPEITAHSAGEILTVKEAE